MSTLDVRPGKLSVRFRPGNAVVLELAWPSGVLDDRTFAATLGTGEDNELDVDVVGDVMTVTATADQTEAITTWARWALVETTTGEDQEVITGRWTASLNGTQSPDDTVAVALDEATVTVTVLGPPGPEGPSGPEGTAAQYVHTQAVPAPSWLVTHNLGHTPICNVLIDDQVVIADVTHLSTSEASIVFAAPTAGVAIFT